MITSFLQYYDRITNFTAKGYETDEILLFLNNAQDDFVKERIFGKNFQPPAFDDNEKRVADVRPLVHHNIIDAIVDIAYGNSFRVDIEDEDSNYLYLIKMDVRVVRTYPTITSEYVPAIRISIKDASRFRSTEFNQTWFKSPVYFAAEDRGVYVIADYFTTLLDSARVVYIRKPMPITESIADYDGTYISTSMSLEPYTHQEIVDMAVDAARGAGREQKSQIEVVEEKSRTK